MSGSADGPSLAEATAVWAKIGVLSFGGPAGQIALIHREVVDERGWIAERDYLDALGFCMFLPGPEAMQLATWCGWRLNGWRGGLIAGLLFVLPGALIIAALAAAYVAYGNVPAMEALFTGIKAAVLIIVVQALVKVARRALKGTVSLAVAACAFLALFVFALPYPLVVAAAALVGVVRGGDAGGGPRVPAPAPRLTARLPLTVALWLLVWWTPVGALALLEAERMVAIGVFFSQLAVVTFGGAYAVLAYMAQDVAQTYGWLTAGEMLDGLGLAETTPGPLILVVEFVGFLAGYGAGGWAGAFGGAVIALWVTFTPCFLWIFAAAPFVSWIAAQPRLRAALDAITAAVVGVIFNLSLWFALHVFFDTVREVEAGPVSTFAPASGTLQLDALLLALLAALLMGLLKRGVVTTLAITAVGGLALTPLI